MRQQHFHQQEKLLESKDISDILKIIEKLKGWSDVTLVPNVCLNIIERKVTEVKVYENSFKEKNIVKSI